MKYVKAIFAIVTILFLLAFVVFGLMVYSEYASFSNPELSPTPTPTLIPKNLNTYNYKFNGSLDETVELSLAQAIMWQEQIDTVDKDYGYRVRCEAFEFMKKCYNGGETGKGNVKFWNTANYLFGSGTSGRYSESVDLFWEKFERISPWFKDLDSNGHRSWDAMESFFRYVSKDNKAQEYIKSVGGVWTCDKNGNMTFDLDSNYYDGLAKALEIPPEALADIMTRLMYFFS